MADEKGVEVSISAINVTKTSPVKSKNGKNVLYAKWYAPTYGMDPIYRTRTVNLALNSGQVKRFDDYIGEQFLFKEKIIGKSKITFELFEEIATTEIEKFLTSLFKSIATVGFGLFTGGGIALPIAGAALKYFLDMIKVDDKTVYSIGQATLEVDSSAIPNSDVELNLMVPKDIDDTEITRDPITGELKEVITKQLAKGKNGTITINFKLL